MSAASRKCVCECMLAPFNEKASVKLTWEKYSMNIFVTVRRMTLVCPCKLHMCAWLRHHYVEQQRTCCTFTCE